MNGEYTCPCCGFFVFSEPAGSYEICPICGWEDDAVQLRFPGMSGGANSESLYESQARTLEDYPIDVMEAEGIARDPEWRPLKTSEVIEFGDQPEQPFDSSVDDSAKYYWKVED
ncbi:MAG: CPCC family cysteine-rich protein [Planctomycetota bacterium]|jgi:hypothetical protein